MEEAKKTKGKNFMAENVCKFHLLGFCPMSELAESKMAGKRNIVDCRKVHSDAMKAEYEQYPDKDSVKGEYERALLPVMEGLLREADAWVAREKANIQKQDGPPEKVTTNNMPPSIKEQYDQLKEDMGKMMAAAESEAEKGNVAGSKFKVMLADEIKAKVQELEEKYIVTYTVTHRGEEVCEICGTRYEALTATNHARHAAHFQGKVHLGYVKIRKWVKELRSKHREADSRSERKVRDRSARGEKVEKSDRGDRGGDRDRDRERHRSRSGGRRERDRADTRDRDRRGGERERGERERDRERDRERRGDRDRERRDR